MDVFTTAMLGRAWPLCVETFQGVAPAKHLGHEVVGGWKVPIPELSAWPFWAACSGASDGDSEYIES